MKKHSPMRKCIGCNLSKEKKDLYRIAYHDGKLVLDLEGSADGRGLYICKNDECIKNAEKRKALYRGFRTNLPAEQVKRIFEELADEQRQNL